MAFLENRYSMEPQFANKWEMYKVRSAAINKFANMGLSGREIAFAVKFETGITVESRDITNLVNAARRRGTVRQLTPQEKKDIAKTAANPWYFTKEVVKTDVESILKNINKLKEKGEPLPQNRLGLKEFRISEKEKANKKKEGGVKVGNRIAFSDGTSIPTFQGLKHDSQWFTRKERNRVVGKLKSLSDTSKVSLDEWTRMSELTSEKTNNKKMVVYFWKKGFVDSDLLLRQELEKLYKRHERILPKDPFAQLRIEVFFKARKMVGNGDTRLLSEYVQIGRNIDDKWFGQSLVEEQRFITSVLSPSRFSQNSEKGWVEDPNFGRVTPADVARGFNPKKNIFN